VAPTSSGSEPDITSSWVVLTRGDRNRELGQALASIVRADPGAEIVLVANGVAPEVLDIDTPQVVVVRSETNLGIPGGRHLGLARTSGDVVFFLDDDARVLSDDVVGRTIERFASAPDLGVVGFRIVDPSGGSDRRHVPRPGRGGADRSGPVASFLGGACAIRRSAYLEAGGYWPELMYAHEELDLAWRLADRGWSIHYDAGAVVEHPRVELSRHRDGWWRTGRNRCLVARRNLPLPVLLVHIGVWSVAGLVRAGRAGSARAYLDGLVDGARTPMASVGARRTPIGWATVLRLSRAGRPPVF
jgi:hypothetical protein